MALKIISQPAQEPMTLSEVKLHLRIDTDEEDTLIAAHILAARQYCEQHQNRAYAQQTIELTLDDWPSYGGEPIEIPRPPLISVETVKYFGTDNAEYIWDPALYFVDTDSEPGRICPAYSEIYPALQLRPINGVKIRYMAGYPPVITTTTIPAGTTPAPVAGTVVNADGTITTTLINDDGSATATTTDYCANVPRTVKNAMLLLIGHWYENREAAMTRTVSKDVEFSVDALLGIDRVYPT